MSFASVVIGQSNLFSFRFRDTRLNLTCKLLTTENSGSRGRRFAPVSIGFLALIAVIFKSNERLRFVV